MSVIETGKELKLENVLSLRKKMTQAQVQQEMMKIGQFLQESGIKKNGPIVTATHAVEQADGQQILDMEVLVPLDRQVKVEGEYKLKEVFHLVNALYARHEGNPNLLQNTYNALMEHINKNKYHQITSGYNVQVNDLKPGEGIENMIMDVYIGVNPSIL